MRIYSKKETTNVFNKKNTNEEIEQEKKFIENFFKKKYKENNKIFIIKILFIIFICTVIVWHSLNHSNPNSVKAINQDLKKLALGQENVLNIKNTVANKHTKLLIYDLYKSTDLEFIAKQMFFITETEDFKPVFKISNSQLLSFTLVDGRQITIEKFSSADSIDHIESTDVTIKNIPITSAIEIYKDFSYIMENIKSDYRIENYQYSQETERFKFSIKKRDNENLINLLPPVNVEPLTDSQIIMNKKINELLLNPPRPKGRRFLLH